MEDCEFDNPAFEPQQIDEDFVDPDILSGDLLPVAQQQVGKGTTVINVALQKELVQTTIDDYYNSLAEQVLTPAFG